MTVRHFQLLVLASTFLYGAFLALPFVGWAAPKPEIEQVLSYAYFGAPPFAYHPFTFVAFFASRLAIAFGLIAFFTWARPAFLAWLVLTVVHSAVGGLYVVPALDATVGYLVTLIDGVLLGIAYSKHFEGLWRKDGEAQQRVPADRPASRGGG
jgi:hypothetical protein